MPHPALLNKTPFKVETLLLADEEGVAQFVPCIQAVFAIAVDGKLQLLEEQPPLNVGGSWRGDPATSSMILEPQVAYAKQGTDVVLLGHAYAGKPGDSIGTVGIRLGSLQKIAAVFGDRHAVRRLGKAIITAPQSFEKLPIVYERAFGGWDRHFSDPLQHRRESRNPVGVGFRVTPLENEEQPLPNFEDPDDPIRSLGNAPAPAGFGFVAPNWMPRLGFAGTFDEAWSKSRKPLLPSDFDPRFYNAGSPGLISPVHLRGDEAGVVIGASPSGRAVFHLPGLPAPVCRIELRGRRWLSLPTSLDTVVVDMDALSVTLIWRAHVAVRNGVHDVLSVEIHRDAESAARVAVATG